MEKGSIDILICTFRRQEVVDALKSLATLSIPEGFRIRIVVADNDETPSAEARVLQVIEAYSLPVLFLHAPARNISIARNACLEAAQSADWIAFLDDDEVADPEWLTELFAKARATGADGVFGPALAEYDADAPNWISAMNYHSNIPTRRNGRVETGHTCNALLRWGKTPWQAERFEISRGKSGGEDTEFFFRVGRLGAQFEIADKAVVREPVAAERLSFRWLRRRKYRVGQSYAASATTYGARLRVGLSALAKACTCGLVALAVLPIQSKRNYWILRGVMHVGVCAGCLSLRQAEHYG